MLLKKYNTQQVFATLISLCLISIPLPYIFSNISLGILIIGTIYYHKELKFKSNIFLFIPILYFLLITISYNWSIDKDSTFRAINKSIFFLIIPIILLFIPPFSKSLRNKIFLYYSYAMAIGSILLLIRACVRYASLKTFDVFFYHELVTLSINAIYVSYFFALAFLCILNKSNKNRYDWISLSLLFILILLLTSKNVIVITLFLSFLSFFIFKRIANPKKLILVCGILICCTIPLSGKIIERFKSELISINDNVVLPDGVISISLKNAWVQENFSPNHYFSGTSLRLYQIRLFTTFIEEDHILLKGYGANAAQGKLIQKQEEFNLQPYFGELNFHNQYIQSFAELGIFGFLFILLMFWTCLYKSIKTKDIIFFCFIILTISLAISESIFARQRGIMFFVLCYSIFNSYRDDDAI